MAKRFLIRVHDHKSGNFIKVWENAQFKGFTKQINGGLSPCEIELGESFDYEGNDLKLNNEVKIFVSDVDTQGSDEDVKLIYSGYISRYVPWARGGEEGIIVNLLGYYTKFAQDILKNGATTTFDYDGNATDIGSLVKAFIDRYIAETSYPKIHYDAGTIKTTSTTTEYKFEMLTYREAIDLLLSMAPEGWFWYVNEHGIMYFKSKPTSATHEFIAKKHFKEIRVERSMEKIINAVLFFAYRYNDAVPPDTLYKLYTDAASIDAYGRRVQKISDNRINESTDADKIAQKFIAEHKNPDIKVIVEILDNNENPDNVLGYDIESINPGDTCTFKGFDDALANIFEENMLITQVDYLLDRAVITIEPMKTGIVKRTGDINKRVDSIERENVSSSYTT